MSDFIITRRAPRSFAQVTALPRMDYDREDKKGMGPQTTIEEDLHNSRRVVRKIASYLANYRVGVDFSSLSNVRVTDKDVILFVRSAIQENKLRQLLPRVQLLVNETGLVRRVCVKIRPITPEVSWREHRATSTPREASEENAQKVLETAASLTDSPLKKALERLGKTLSENRHH